MPGTIYSRQILFLLFTCCLFFYCGDKVPNYWPANGSSVRNISWYVPLADSSALLHHENNIWTLPRPLNSNQPETTFTHHIKPQKRYLFDAFDKFDQIVTHHSGRIQHEYYRFRRNGVFLLGYSGADSSKLYTIYEPPLLILPDQLNFIDSTLTSETVPKIRDAAADSFRTDHTTRLRLTVKQRGQLKIGTTLVPAVLVKMSLSRDATVGFGDQNLIVPDAVMVQSYVLVAPKIGPVLEWEIQTLNDRSSLPADEEFEQKAYEPFERIIKITRHQFF